MFNYDPITVYTLIDAICISVLVVMLIVGRTMRYGVKYSETAGLIVTEIVACLSDLVWYILLPLPTVSPVLKTLIKIVYFSALSVMSYLWIKFAVSLIQSKALDKKINRIIILIPAIVLIIIPLLTLVTDKSIFYFDESGKYIKTSKYILEPLIGFIYLSAVSVHAMRIAVVEKVVFRRRLCYAIALFTFAPFLFYIIQTYVPMVPLYCIGCTIALVFVTVSIREQTVENQSAVARALTESYEIITLVDLSNGQYTDYRAGDFVESMNKVFTGKSDTFSECVMRFAETYVYEEDKKDFYTKMSSYNLIRELSKHGETLIDTRLITPNGLEYYRVKAVADDNFRDNYLCVVGVKNVDEYTRKELNQKLLLEEALSSTEDANAAKTAFLFNMSHDIRTPMNAVLGFANLAKKKVDTDPEQTKEYLDKIELSGQHMLKLLNDVLDMASIEAGKITIENKPTDVHHFGDTIVAMTANMAESHDIKVNITYDDIKHELIYADLLHMNQILLNIVTNSIKYTRPGGKVDVVFREMPCRNTGYANYVITIEDNGIGMNPEFLKHIFESFARERSTTDSGIQGVGLGMSITKRLVDLLGGSIEIESELGVGTKTTLKFKIRTRDAEDDKEPEPVDYTQPVFDLRDKRILVVEDNELNREITQELLEERGMIVDLACDGVEAVAKMKGADPGDYDLILMDIQMPNMDGYEATRKIREIEHVEISKVPIVALTANAFEEDKQKAFDAGMDGFLTKPVKPDDLIDTVSGLIKNS